MESMDIIAQNVENIGNLFPDCITEARDENGKIQKVVDRDRLMQKFSHKIIGGGTTERYEFTWVGKNASRVEANTITNKTLRPCIEESKDWDNTENLYIEGDNLEVLKLLQNSYFNKVKMIYIDPPYNTGNDFIYVDDFAQNIDEYEEAKGSFDEEGNRLFKNTDTNGRFHSDWCSMIYPRLILARNLLADDGVIFISIDDNEQENLKKICDEVFGAKNFMAQITRNTNSSKNQSLFISVTHEYCLLYAKNIEFLKEKNIDSKWSVEKNNIKEYLQKVKFLKDNNLTNEEITKELKELTKYPRFIDFTNYWYFDEKGLYRKDNLGGVKNGNKNPIINPLTNEYDPVPPGGFRYNVDTMQKLIENNRIHFHTDGSLPTLKRYLAENLKQRPKSIMSDDQRPDGKLLKDFGLEFDNPKQLAFIKRLVSVFQNDCIFLDFFSGSATTAHAVMQLNAEDGGKRKFIMVQLPEKTDEKSEAFKAGYKNICEIGKERIRRAGEQIKEEAGLNGQDLDIGFRVLKLDSSNMKDIYYSADEYDQGMLENMQSNTKEDRTDLDLLFGCLVDWGLELNKPYTTKVINDHKVHIYNDGDLVACFENDLDMKTIDEIAKLQALRVVFSDNSFIDSATKINVAEHFKMIAPDTDIKVI